MTTEPSQPGTRTILVVDDNIKTAELVARMLAAPGRLVRLALSGRDALAWFAEHRDEVSLVLMDETMPDLDGHLVAERMWTSRSDLPIFLMSGLDEQEISALMAARPFMGFLKKPFRSWELQLRVQSVLGT